MLPWLFSLMGRSHQPDGRAIENSIQALSADEARWIAETLDRTITELRTRYPAAATIDVIALLQGAIDEGNLAADLTPLGIVWGDLICRECGTEWVTAEWDGVRMFAVNVPGTTILMFPVAMLEKRRERQEAVNFSWFLRNTVDAVSRMKADPAYLR